MSYIQGFVIPVKKDNKEAYRAMAEQTAPLLREYGAQRVVECWGEDVPDGKVTDFKRAVDAQEGENVVFSWIVWPDRETCDAAAQRMMQDDRMPGGDLPFDAKRLIYGGFAPIFDTDA